MEPDPAPAKNPICEKCLHPHPEKADCLEVVLASISTLLLRVGEASTCRCGRAIFWVRHINGKRAPYTKEGLLHFRDCPAAADWRRPYQPKKKDEHATLPNL